MLRQYVCPRANPPLLVSELIDQTSAKWDRQRVEEVLLGMDAKTVMAIPRVLVVSKISRAGIMKKKIHSLAHYRTEECSVLSKKKNSQIRHESRGRR